MAPELVHPIEPLALPVATLADVPHVGSLRTFSCACHTPTSFAEPSHDAFVKRTPLHRPKARSPERCFFPGHEPKLETAQRGQIMWMT